MLGLLVLLRLAVGESREDCFEEECGGREADQFFDHNYRIIREMKKLLTSIIIKYLTFQNSLYG